MTSTAGQQSTGRGSPAPGGPNPVITARSVTKSWGSAVVLSDISVDINPGITGLLGSNGAGKTTFFGMVLGLHLPSSGELRVLGHDPATSGAAMRERIGYGPEHHDLPPDVAAQDFVRHLAMIHGLPKREATTRASDALWLVGLGEERARPVGTMSTGQRQRVKLAQAISHDPELVLLDEPTDGLDPVQRDDMLELIRRIGTEFGMNIVLSSHLLEEVERVADSVVIINDGKVVADGLLSDLRGDRSGAIIEVDSGQAELVTALQARGLDVQLVHRRVVVDDAGAAAPMSLETILDHVRDAAVEVGAPIRRLQSAESSLEDLFLEQVGAQ